MLPAALLETALLLGGVAILCGAIGVGTAWLVTAHRFPGRASLAWLLPLPLAVPTYITAYVYVELFDAAGPVQSGLRALTGWRSPAEYWFPEVRSLPGCILVMSAVLYPYVYAAARAMFVTQSACMLEVARTLGAGRFELFRTVALPLARPALAIGLSLALLEALNDIGASEYLGVRTLTVSVYTTWLNRGSLRGRGADRLRDARDRDRPHRARAARPAPSPLRDLDPAAAHGAAGTAAARARLDRGCRLRGAGVAGLHAAGGLPPARRGSAGAFWPSSTRSSWGIS